MLTAVYNTGSSTDVVVNSESLEIEVIYKDFTPSQLTWSRD